MERNLGSIGTTHVNTYKIEPDDQLIERVSPKPNPKTYPT